MVVRVIIVVSDLDSGGSATEKTVYAYQNRNMERDGSRKKDTKYL